MSVSVLNIGFLTPFFSGNLLNKQVLPDPNIFDLKDYGGQGKGIEINKEYLKSLNFEAKSLMSKQTQIALKAFHNCLTEELKQSIISLKGSIFVCNGHISLDDSTVKIISKYLFDTDHKINFNLFGENIERMPPLDGIKVLSTAISHFVAKELNVHHPGHQIYSGDNSLSGISCRTPLGILANSELLHRDFESELPNHQPCQPSNYKRCSSSPRY